MLVMLLWYALQNCVDAWNGMICTFAFMLKTQNYIHVTKYYKKIIVSRSLIHCIYIHVYVYSYDIMLRIFANSMCTWLLYETFFYTFHDRGHRCIFLKTI